MGGRYRSSNAKRIAVVASTLLLGSGILTVNGFSPSLSNLHQSTNKNDTQLNLTGRNNACASKIGTKPAPSIVELQETFSWKLPSTKDQSPSPSPPTSPKNNTKRNLLAAGTLLLAAATLLPSSSSAASALSTSSITDLTDSFADTGFYQAFSLVFVSEIGDKTFFIAGLIAAQSSRLLSFLGSVSALAAMTVISVVIGQIFHNVPEGLTQGLPLDDICAVAAFTFFGVKTLIEASECEEGEGCTIDSELAEAEEDVGGLGIGDRAGAWAKIVSTFGLVFAAEFGDRSFLSTIALSAAQNPFSVGAGSIAAHAIATGIAVAGGAYVAKYISEKTIGYIGGSLFIVFAVTTALPLIGLG